MKTYAYAIILILVLGLAGYVIWLQRERTRLLSFEKAYEIQGDFYKNQNTFSNSSATETNKTTKGAIADMLKQNEVVKEELSELKIRMRNIDSYTRASMKSGESLKGIMKDVDSLKVFSKKDQLSSRTITYNPKTDSVELSDSIFCDISVILHHHRKKFLGIGLGRKMYETTVKSSNPNIYFGRVESFQVK